MRNIILSTFVLSAFAVPAMAQTVTNPQVYGSAGYTHLETDGGDLGAVTGRIGARLTPYLGVEGETSFGVRKDDRDVAGVPVEVRHRYDVAAYGVATLPVRPNIDLFARAGYGVTEVQAEAAGVQTSDHLQSFNYGAGAEYRLDGQNGIRADWTRRDFRDDGGEADTYALSYVRRF